MIDVLEIKTFHPIFEGQLSTRPSNPSALLFKINWNSNIPPCRRSSLAAMICGGRDDRVGMILIAGLALPMLRSIFSVRKSRQGRKWVPCQPRSTLFSGPAPRGRPPTPTRLPAARTPSPSCSTNGARACSAPTSGVPSSSTGCWSASGAAIS